MEKEKYLFISHAEKDYDIISHFIDFLYGMGLNGNEMFCSSRSELGIRKNVDIYDYLRTRLDSNNVIPVFMLSQNYYNSPACLNEMGAVWMKQNEDYFTFLLPGFDFEQIKGGYQSTQECH